MKFIITPLLSLLVILTLLVLQSTTSATTKKCLKLTMSQIEGPFYKTGSPERSDISINKSNTITISGFVYKRGKKCIPLPNIKIDIWQADPHGNYDNSGYNYRGHFFTGVDGSFSFITEEPGEYVGRTEHIHVKIFGPKSILTTQLYFPGISDNSHDDYFAKQMLLKSTGDKTYEYNFVVV
jgi:protocatechuate 3,4-dioxygenase beta subunit